MALMPNMLVSLCYIRYAKKEGITIILVTHDIGVVADTATEVACLNKHLHFHGTTEDFKSLDEVEISKIYGHQYNLLIINTIVIVVMKILKLDKNIIFIEECNL